MRHGVWIAMLLTLAACDDRPSVEAGISGERLLASPPSGWLRTYELDEAGMRLVEFMPQRVDGDDWTDKVSFESFTGPELPDPIILVQAIARDREQTCTNLDDFNTYSGYENNYATSVRLLLCHENKGSKRGEITMLKTIQGNDAFYVIQRTRRVAPFSGQDAAPMRNDEMGLWSLYFRAISVCDDSRTEHPCPGPASDVST